MLLTSGLSLLLLAAFYLVIDVWNLRAWAAFFVVIGCNSIFIYLAQRMINFDYTAHFLFDGITGYRVAPDDPRTRLAFTIGVVALKWLLLYGLYRKRLFVRLGRSREFLCGGAAVRCRRGRERGFGPGRFLQKPKRRPEKTQAAATGRGSADIVRGGMIFRSMCPIPAARLPNARSLECREFDCQEIAS